MCRVTRTNVCPDETKLTAQCVRPHCRLRAPEAICGPDSSKPTSSEARPDGFTRWVSNRNASRSSFPAGPRATSVRMKPQSSPSTFSRWRSARRFPRTSWIAITSQRRMNAAMYVTSAKLRAGEAPADVSHVFVKSAKARRFPGADEKVPMWRLCRHYLIVRSIQPRDLRRNGRRRSNDVRLRHRVTSLAKASLNHSQVSCAIVADSRPGLSKSAAACQLFRLHRLATGGRDEDWFIRVGDPSE